MIIFIFYSYSSNILAFFSPFVKYYRCFICKSINGIPFEVKLPQFSNEMLEAIKEAEEIEKNPENYKKYHSVDELMRE